MTLKVTYYYEYEIHKSIYVNVTHWYYTNGNLVIISENDDNSNVIIVAHGMFNTYLILAATGLGLIPDFNFSQNNTGVTLIRYLYEDGIKKTAEFMKREFKHIGRGAVCGVCMRVCPKGIK